MKAYLQELEIEASKKGNIFDVYFRDLTKRRTKNSRKFNAEKVLQKLMLKEVKNTEKLDFAPVLSFAKLCDKDLNFTVEMLKKFLPQSKYIREFTIIATAQNDTRPEKIKVGMLTEICKFRNLETLKIENFYFDFNAIHELCKDLPALRILDLKIKLSSEELFRSMKEFREAFKNLKTFYFSSSWDQTEDSEMLQETLTNWFVTTQQSLEFVGDQKCFTDMSTSCFNYDLKEPSCLQHMSISMKTETRLKNDAFKSFPKVRNISLRWEEHELSPPIKEVNMGSLLQIPELECVKLINLRSTSYLEFFLINIGKRLKNLDVGLVPFTVKDFRFVEIGHCCPNLEELKIHYLNRLADDAAWFFSSFSKLTVLDLKILSSKKDEKTSLSDFLAAPKLEIVKLIGISVCKEGLSETSALIESEEILTKIKSLTLRIRLTDCQEEIDEVFTEPGEGKRLISAYRTHRPHKFLHIETFIFNDQGLMYSRVEISSC